MKNRYEMSGIVNPLRDHPLSASPGRVPHSMDDYPIALAGEENPVNVASAIEGFAAEIETEIACLIRAPAFLPAVAKEYPDGRARLRSFLPQS